MRAAVANRSLFREVNQRILAIALETWKARSEPIGFVCECGGCTELVQLLRAEYEAVRSTRGQFVLLSGHESPELDHVAARANGYLITQVT